MQILPATTSELMTNELINFQTNELMTGELLNIFE